jgi:hypothetical protein
MVMVNDKKVRFRDLYERERERAIFLEVLVHKQEVMPTVRVSAMVGCSFFSTHGS